MSQKTARARLQIGMPAPNLRLVDVEDQPVSVSDLWPNGPTVLTFLRHFG